MLDEPVEFRSAVSDGAGEQAEFTISTDRTKLDLEVVHGFLANSYWARGIPKRVLERAIENSICFGIYANDTQVGFARVVTDLATYGYLADVFVIEPYRGRGLSKWLVECVLAHPDLQGLRRLSLFTRDAASLYERFGFAPSRSTATYLEIWKPNVYAERAPR
jgi:GNAT superfamily N-acetyltransferase